VKKIFGASLLAAGLALANIAQAAPTLLNVSYDVMRDFYKDYNTAFQKHWQAEHNENITVQMSFGGSSKQARSVIDGLPADVITMNMATDINALADNGKLVPENWVTRLPNNSAPFTSATVFIVRKGNPKALKDWPDLLKDGVQVIVPNPKTSGNGRYTYLSAWGYVLKNGGREQGQGFRRQTVQASAGARYRWPCGDHDLHDQPDRRRAGDLRKRSGNDRPRVWS
jgi:sulfate transport system substrate-binding protein